MAEIKLSSYHEHVHGGFPEPVPIEAVLSSVTGRNGSDVPAVVMRVGADILCISPITAEQIEGLATSLKSIAKKLRNRAGGN